MKEILVRKTAIKVAASVMLLACSFGPVSPEWLGCAPAIAVESDGSLDSLWNDESGTNSAPTSSTTAPAKSTAAPDSNKTTAPTASPAPSTPIVPAASTSTETVPAATAVPIDVGPTESKTPKPKKERRPRKAKRSKTEDAGATAQSSESDLAPSPAAGSTPVDTAATTSQSSGTSFGTDETETSSPQQPTSKVFPATVTAPPVKPTTSAAPAPEPITPKAKPPSGYSTDLNFTIQSTTPTIPKVPTGSQAKITAPKVTSVTPTVSQPAATTEPSSVLSTPVSTTLMKITAPPTVTPASTSKPVTAVQQPATKPQSTTSGSASRVVWPVAETTATQPAKQASTSAAPTPATQPKTSIIDTTRSSTTTQFDKPNVTPSRASQSASTGGLSTPALRAALPEPKASDVGDVAAPMCNVSEFKDSDLVKNPIWPGVGPFTEQGTNEFSDQAKNRLKLTVSDARVTAAQLALTNSTASQAFLHLQMSVDFLLEALGAKGQKIADFNKQLEQSKDQIGSSTAPITLNAGNYNVAIQQPDKSAYLITVNNRQTNKKVVSDLQGQSSSTTSNTVDQGGWNDIAGSTTTGTTATQRPTQIVSAQTSRTQASVATQTSSASTQTSAGGQDTMKDLFLELIKRWQQIKKVAVRQRQAADLPQVLSGSALTRQSNSIKWLSANNKLYDISPRTLQVDRYIALEPGRKYAVYVKIKELSKLMDATNNTVVKESEDSYNVNYTIEKVGDQWFISDSAVISASAQAQKPAPHR